MASDHRPWREETESEETVDYGERGGIEWVDSGPHRVEVD